MTSSKTVREVKMYSDYKSPFAYLAFDPAFELEHKYRERLRWILITPAAGGVRACDDLVPAKDDAERPASPTVVAVVLVVVA